MKHRATILLTACVNPGGMSYTVLQDPELRKRQYCEALDFYLQNTSLPVVFMENTHTDFSSEYQDWIDRGRLEYLTFDGNSGFDKIKGKGYGEALMLLYALEHSRMLAESKYLIKITGRLKVENVEEIGRSRWLLLDKLWRSNIENQEWITTTCFCTTPAILRELLLRHKEEISEEDRGHNWIENVFARAFVTDTDIPMRIVPFFASPVFHANSGTSNSPYPIKSDFINATDNIHELVGLLRRRHQPLAACCWQLVFYAYMLRHKLKAE